jgi:hypothetical protein
MKKVRTVSPEAMQSMLRQIETADQRIMATFEEMAVMEKAMEIRLKAMRDQMEEVMKWRSAINFQVAVMRKRIQMEGNE